MSSLDETFEELLDHLRHPERLNPARSDDVLYVVYPAEEMLEAKAQLPLWRARLREAGFTSVRVSLSDLLWQLVDDSGLWDTWLEAEQDFTLGEMNASISNVLSSKNALVGAVERVVTGARPGDVVLVTECETLHPYFRTRAIEAGLTNKVKVPTVFLYPGRRSGQFGLHFLGLHDLDGNYRSTIIGG